MSVAESQPAVPKPSVRWFHLTPDRLILALLVIEGLLWLSDRIGWPVWHKGYAVLTAVASVAMAMLVMLVWFAGSLVLRWRFQFSMRSLLVLVVAVALPCSWLAVEMKEAREQREAVEAITKATGAVIYDYEKDRSGRWIRNPQLTAPLWLVNLLGRSFFSNVVFAKVMPGTELGHLKTLNHLQTLCLDGTSITDAGLEHVVGMSRLRELYLCDTQITDAGLGHIKRLKELETLWLDGTAITDAGLKHLKGLNQLQSLFLNFTGITDAGLENLEGTKQLRQLYLQNTRITDAGLKRLTGLKELTTLWLWETDVTEEGILELHKVLPKCEISDGP